MNKKHFSFLGFGIILSILFLAHAVSASSTLSVTGYPNSGCNASRETSISIAENRSFYITNAWIGGMGDWDDQIGFSGTFNGQVMVNETAGWSLGCSDNATAGNGYVGTHFLTIGGSTDADSFTFSLLALQKRNEISSTNTFHGSVEYDYLVNNCNFNQFTLHNSCVPVSGTITAFVPGYQGQSATCTAPCSPSFSYILNPDAADGPGGYVFGYSPSNFQTLSSGQNGGSFSVSNLPAGIYTYILYSYGGSGIPSVVDTATVNVTAPAPTASLTINGSHSASVVVGDSATMNWSSTNGSTYSSTWSTQNSGNGCSTSPSPWVANNSSGSASTGVTTSAQVACGQYTITYTVTNSAGVSSSDSITLTVTNPAPPPPPTAPTATLSASPSISMSSTSPSGSGTVSNSNSTNGGSFVVYCEITSNPSKLSLSIQNCPPPLGPNAVGSFIVSVGSGGPTAPGSYSAIITVTAEGQNGTVVTNPSQPVAVSYTISPPTGTLSLTASPDTVYNGGSSTLIASVPSNASYPCAVGRWDGSSFFSMATINQGSDGIVVPTGSLGITTTYRLRCPATGSNFSSKDATVTVLYYNPPNPPPPPPTGTTVDFSFSSTEGTIWTILSGTPRYRADYDYNDDGKLDKADRDILQNNSLKSKCPSGKTCDINASGSFNIGDALAYTIYLYTLDIYQYQNGGYGTSYLQSTTGATVTLSFSATSTLQASFGPNPVVVPKNGTATSIFTIPSSVAAGNYAVTISGTAPGVSKQASNRTLYLNVIAPPNAPTLSYNFDSPVRSCNGTSSQMTLSWTPASGGGTPTGYDVYLVTTRRSFFRTTTTYTKLNSSQIPATSTSYTYSGLTYGASYNYVVTASNGAGTSFYSNQAGPVYAISCAVPPMSGTLTPSSSSCVIPARQGYCDMSFSWNIVNPVAASYAITSSTTNTGTSAANTIVASENGSSGTSNFIIPYNSRTFYLYNNGIELDQKTVTSSCTSGTTWNVNTKICAPNPIDGACGTLHYSCAQGTSVNNVNGTSSYTWGCNGLNSGSNATPSCVELKPCTNGASNPPSCTIGNGICLNGATNPPTCSLNPGGTCPNGATNPPSCTTGTGGCLNGATNPPTCSLNPGGTCPNGAVNPPNCTLTGVGGCVNGDVNPPLCTERKKPAFQED